MENNSEDILASIQERNRRVEIQKAWETSWTRRAFIVGMTYATAFLYMSQGLGESLEDAFMHAFVPAGGYLLSTFSLPLIKNGWIQRFYGQTPKILPKT